METKEDFNALVAASGLSVSARFVPFSQSRNAKQTHPSLNWVVTLSRNGRALFSCDYMAGSGHAPAYKNPPKAGSALQYKAIQFECETGLIAYLETSGTIRAAARGSIEPDAANVIACVLLDCDALFYSGFESWADEFGYDADSIRARAMYDECLSKALALRAALGDASFNALREAAREL